MEERRVGIGLDGRPPAVDSELELRHHGGLPAAVYYRGWHPPFIGKDRVMSVKRHGVGPRLSQAVVHGDTVYLAGMVAGDPSADTKGQTEQILKKIDETLAVVGSGKSKLLSATVYLANMATYNEMNAAWDAWVDRANTPARATVEARLAAPKYLVEIMAVAAL